MMELLIDEIFSFGDIAVHGIFHAGAVDRIIQHHRRKLLLNAHHRSDLSLFLDMGYTLGCAFQDRGDLAVFHTLVSNKGKTDVVQITFEGLCIGAVLNEQVDSFLLFIAEAVTDQEAVRFDQGVALAVAFFPGVWYNNSIRNLVVTDPPYNVAVKNSQGMTIANDNMASDEFRIFLRNAFAAAYPVLDKGCPFYVWFASKEHINFEGALNDVGLQVRQELIWNKNHFILGRAHYQWKHEPCLYGWKGDSCRYFIDVRNRASVIEDNTEINIDKMKAAEMRALLHKIYEERIPTTVVNCMKPNKDEDHPTMKPVRLFGYQMANSSRPGDIILDSFGGSGTTIVAAEQLGRKARLMEYDPHYSDVIIARWEKLTGQKAVKLNL